MLVVQHWVEVIDCRSPPRCPQTNEKLGFVHLETDRLGGLDHFFTQLLTCAAVSFLDSSTPSMSMCLGLPVLLPMRLWLPTPTTLRSGQEFSLVLLFLNAVWCRHLREDTWWACSSLERLLPMRLWLPTPTTLRSGQEFSLVLLFLNAVWCRHLREDTWWACSSLERLLSNNCDHWPFWNNWTRSSNFFLGTMEHHPRQKHTSLR